MEGKPLGIYNVKTIRYQDSLQVRIFGKPVVSREKIVTSSIKSKRLDNPKSMKRTDKQIQHCLKTSVNRTVNQIYSISRSNKWEYFITLTIDPQKLDSMDFDLILNKLNIWTNNLKKRYAPDLKYIFVPELHKDKKKWHFHGLFTDIGNIPLVFSGKVCVGKYTYDYARKPYATKIFNLPLWKYGFSTATRIRDSAKSCSYITKYISKDLTHVLKNKHRYVSSQNLNTPIERVYNIDYDVLADIMRRNMHHIDYVSNISVRDAGQEISYLEFNND